MAIGAERMAVAKAIAGDFVAGDEQDAAAGVWIAHTGVYRFSLARVCIIPAPPYANPKYRAESRMAQFIYTMNRVSKVVPPKRIILRDISLSFFPGAKIGVLGLNGSGKSTLLKIMAGVDKNIDGEARAQTGIRIGYLPQEPQLDEQHT